MQPDTSPGHAGMMASGRMMHRRFKPRTHSFSYRLCLCWLDLDHTERLNHLPFWSADGQTLWQRLALMQFRQTDYFWPENEVSQPADRSTPLKQRLLAWIAAHPDGVDLDIARVVLCGQLRQWGYCFNPVVFFMCYDADGQIIAIVSEITNTPWNERHAYLHRVDGQHPMRLRFSFSKAFHVSPFMPMNQRYEWRFAVSESLFAVHMNLWEDDTNQQGDVERSERVFDASMQLALEPLTAARAIRQPLVYPLQTAGLVFAIYWQALRLYLKRIPFFSNPHTRKSAVENEGIQAVHQGVPHD
ncbi:DUF1365 domain-containing protein [Allohahella marinimesophila]|uniref:DUF1365 domain-containing protein n=1 Tax=Allohahella marinimesophila TaxID=1054972 RepID=A0ABP7PDR7_9GAMM